jgi:hypothetical protein
MALLNFPDPGVIQTYTANGNTWEWNGTSWISANNLNLSDQVTGVLGTVYGGTGKALSGMSVGSVIYADTSSSFAALAPGTNNYVLATQGSGSAPYWKIDDSGTGSVGNGNTGGFAYYTGLNSITSGTAVSYIAASNRIVLTSQILSLPSSVIDSGIWAGTAISLANGGTNGNRAGIAISYELAVYNAAGTAITQIDTTSAIGNSVLLQVSQTVMPTWVGQSSLVAGGAITSQKWHEARTVTFATGDVTGSFSIDGSANVSNVALTIGADSVALGTDTTGNYVGFVNTAGTGLSIIGSAGEGIGFTVVSNATNNNTASTIVARDGSGDFSAGTITANLTGTASIATSSRLVNTLATTDTRYLAGVVLNTGVGSTQIYTGSGITIGSNIITATTFAGNATSATNSGFAGIATSAILAGIGSTVGTAFLTGVLTNSASGGTQIFTGSGITIGNNVITSTSFQGTATSSVTSGAAGKWIASRTVTFATGDVTGSFSIDGSANVSNVALTIAADSVALGTDTTGNYALSVATSGSGISTIGAAGEGTAFTIVSNATPENTNSTLVFRDAAGLFAAAGATFGTVQIDLVDRTVTTSTGNLILDSGGGTVDINDNVTISGNLTVNGTTTTVNSTISTIVDPVITLGTAIGGTNPSSDDNKDRGIEFKYLSGTAKTGFFGFDDSTGFFTFIPDAANSSEVFSGTTGVIDATRITGSASSWTSPITFSLGGDLSGSVSFSGTGNTTLTATIAANSVALGTDTTGQYASTIAISGSGISATAASGDDGTAYTIYSSAVSTNTASSIVLRDASGDFSAGTITANLTGTASIATSSRLVNTLATNETRYLAGVVLNTSAGSTQIYTGSGITIGNNVITATTFQGTATSSTTSGLAGIATSAILVGIGTTVGTAFLTGVLTNSASGGTQIFTGSGITIGNNVITSTSFQGTATSSITSGLAATALNAGIAWTSNFSGSAFTSTNAGLSQRVNLSQFTGAGTSFLVFSDVINGTAALGATGFIKITASTGSIGASSYTGTWTGTAVTALYGGTGLASVNKLDVLTGASSGNSWIAIGSTFLPSAYIGENAPAALAAFGATQPGQLWWDSTYGVLKVYYADTNTNQWVDALPVLGSNGGSAVKRSFILSFGAGFTPSTGSDSVSIAIPYAPDNTSLFYFIKRLDFRNETTSSGAGVSFYIERNTTQSPTTAWTTANTITSAAGSSFKAGAGIYITSYTNSGSGASFVSSAGVAASVMSGDYLRLNFSALNSAATMSVSIIIEQQ